MIAILYKIRSAHNVGSIFRTADAGGIKKIYLCGYTPAPINEVGIIQKDIAKTALGAEKFIPWDNSCRSTRAISKLIENLKKDGYQILAIEQSKNSLPYYKFKFSKKQKIALIVGNEIKGVPKSILEKCDKVLEIPMFGKKESLNVSVAFGIVVFGLIKK